MWNSLPFFAACLMTRDPAAPAPELRWPVANEIAAFGSQTPGTRRQPDTGPSNSLARAQATFRALDLDGDGKLGTAELERFRRDVTPWMAFDADRDGKLARDEFVLAYRAFVRTQGQVAATDLDAEAARIEALRRTVRALGNARPLVDATLGARVAKPAVADDDVARAFATVERALLAESAGVSERAALRELLVVRGKVTQPALASLGALDRAITGGGALVVVRLRELRAALGLDVAAHGNELAASAKPDPRRVRADAACEDLANAIAAGRASARDFARLRTLVEFDAAASDELDSIALRAAIAGLSRAARDELVVRLRTCCDRANAAKTKAAKQVGPASPPTTR